MTTTITRRLIEQLTAINNAPSGFLRFCFEPGDEIKPQDMFIEGRKMNLIEWKVWMYRDEAEWREARLTDHGKKVLAEFEGVAL